MKQPVDSTSECPRFVYAEQSWDAVPSVEVIFMRGPGDGVTIPDNPAIGASRGWTAPPHDEGRRYSLASIIVGTVGRWLSWRARQMLHSLPTNTGIIAYAKANPAKVSMGQPVTKIQPIL